MRRERNDIPRTSRSGVLGLKVKAVLDAGIEFQNVSGPMRTVPRPDLKNDRAVEAIAAMPIKKVVDGRAVLQENLSLDQVYAYCKRIFGW